MITCLLCGKRKSTNGYDPLKPDECACDETKRSMRALFDTMATAGVPGAKTVALMFYD